MTAEDRARVREGLISLRDEPTMAESDHGLLADAVNLLSESDPQAARGEVALWRCPKCGRLLTDPPGRRGCFGGVPGARTLTDDEHPAHSRTEYEPVTYIPAEERDARVEELERALKWLGRLTSRREMIERRDREKWNAEWWQVPARLARAALINKTGGRE